MVFETEIMMNIWYVDGSGIDFVTQESDVKLRVDQNHIYVTKMPYENKTNAKGLRHSGIK